MDDLLKFMDPALKIFENKIVDPLTDLVYNRKPLYNATARGRRRHQLNSGQKISYFRKFLPQRRLGAQSLRLG